MSLTTIFIGLVIAGFVLTQLPLYIGVPLALVAFWKLFFRE